MRFEAVIVGGAALGLLEVVSRETRDCDVLSPDLPEPLRRAAAEFALQQRAAGYELADDWLNNGPASLADALPQDWRQHVRPAFRGHALKLAALGRMDMLRDKLFALCDRGIDLQDCLALRPTEQELDEVFPWLEVQDGNPQWPQHVQETLNDLQRRLADAV